MGIIEFKYNPITREDGHIRNSLSREEFESFNSNILGLGDISQDGKIIQALVAIFDLQGFTNFFNQTDPHIVIPEYLSKFLSWLFNQISLIVKIEEQDDQVIIRGNLPFFAKFLGDGLLFIWDSDQILGKKGIGNIIVALRIICNRYINNFLPEINRCVSKAPKILRCGIARGQIISIGNGQDFVGPCINIASRLQKLGKISFAFHRKGFDIEEGMRPAAKDRFILKRIPIAGIGEDELVYIPKDEFGKLSAKEKNIFKEP